MIHVYQRQVVTVLLSLVILLLVSSMPAGAQSSSDTFLGISGTSKLRPAAGIVGKVWWITDDWGEPLGMTIVRGKTVYSGQIFLEEFVPASGGGDVRFEAGFFPCDDEDDSGLKASDEENVCEELDCWITYRNCKGERAVWPHVIDPGAYEKFRQRNLARPIKIDPAWLNMRSLHESGNLVGVPDASISTGIRLFKLE